MRIVIFGFDDFGEKVAKTIGKKELSIVVFNENEEKRAKKKLYDVIRLEDITDDELSKIEYYDVGIALLKAGR